MLHKIFSFISKLLSIILSLLLLLNLPYLFITQERFTFQPFQFFKHFFTMLKEVFSPTSLIVLSSDTPFGYSKKIPLFPTVLEPYTYSFTVLFGCLYSCALSFSWHGIFLFFSNGFY